jgi:ATP-dependent protease ClpP protease subunit
MTVHTIHFMREINPETLTGLQNVCLGALQGGATEINIHLSSIGGGTDYGFTAYHFLRSLPVRLTIHCISNVESMAVILFLAADTRLIVPHGKVKIHPMHWGFNAGAVDHDRLREFVDSMDFDADRYSAIFKERTQGADKPVDVSSHLLGKANILDSQSALSAGIATGIAEATIPKDAVRWWV